jgi:hypothetical protein
MNIASCSYVVDLFVSGLAIFMAVTLSGLMIVAGANHIQWPSESEAG